MEKQEEEKRKQNSQKPFLMAELAKLLVREELLSPEEELLVLEYCRKEMEAWPFSEL